jgi:hypothetical protein
MANTSNTTGCWFLESTIDAAGNEPSVYEFRTSRGGAEVNVVHHMFNGVMSERLLTLGEARTLYRRLLNGNYWKCTGPESAYYR